MNNPLEKYGAALTEEGQITRDGKLLGVFCKRVKGRWQVRNLQGLLVFSGRTWVSSWNGSGIGSRRMDDSIANLPSGPSSPIYRRR